jgi:polar amino acid transport system substrate-binding protein
LFWRRAGYSHGDDDNDRQTGFPDLPDHRACFDAELFGTAQADEVFDLSPEQPARIRAEKNDAAIAAISKDFTFVSPGKFTVAVSPGGPPLATYATDAKTVVGADPDYASAIADSIGLELELVPVAWIDWPLGLVSGKYDAVISNVGVTEQRKEKFDFSTYRQGCTASSSNPTARSA